MTSSPIQISLNGETHQTAAQTIAGLLAEMDWNPRGVAVAVNGSVVPRAQHGEWLLRGGDQLEIIRAVQGG